SYFFDPSTLPTIALQRLEVVADGSSALYGSDAIGGAVIMVLRKDFNGAEITGRYGDADGYDRHQFAGIFGQTWGSGSITLSAERAHHSNLPASDRPNLY